MTTLPRRRLFGAFAAPLALPLAAGTLTGLPARPAAARAQGPLPAAPALAQLRIGRTRVTFLSDGFIAAPTAWFEGLPAAELERRIAARTGGDGKSVRLNFTVWLVDDGERLVLLDAGTGGQAGATSGRLLSALAALGVRPQDIDLVAISHTHFDHIAGLIAEGRAAFPNAELLMPRADVAAFTDPARRAAAPDFLRSSFDLTAQVVSLYPRLQRIDGERAITPFISTVDLAGHTPGHTGFRVADGGQSLLLVADAMFDPAFHPGRTDIRIVFETDPAAARAMRERLFARAAEERALLAATHLSFPGLGMIEREGGDLRWVPSDFPYAA